MVDTLLVPILVTRTGFSLMLTFLLNITDMSFLDAVGCVSDDLCVVVLLFEALWLILFKLDVDERPIIIK